ncbi:hypothetical protein ACOCJ7_19215 [Knoellia sp. CPCC 206453]|uniref:hypothetical protein n=1 Tax=Knoellia pratensis TaxID=3404796 RepID=UPI00362427A8
MTVFKGERPDDTESWRAMRNWAALYPAQALPATLTSVALLVIALGFPNVWGDLRWFFIAWACLVLLSAAFLLYLSWATRRNPGPIMDAPE